MRHRIYAPEPFAPGDRIAIRGDELHHAARVVRVREGEEVELFDGKGIAAHGVITAVQQDQLVVNVLTIIDAREARLSITLAMSIIALDRFELVLQKATELGVRSILPIVTERVEIRPERYRGKQERWERIIFEAVKQCGRARTPQLESPLPYLEAIARPGMKVVLDADTDPSPSVHASPEPQTLFIGPEGGWSEHELELARTAGARFRRLGARRLRAETAAIVALTRSLAESGDLD
ncbi:MAG TPA: RsmE family RNA methyltransferase [Thermoanaerobaculia bacterium]|nr:RsmE family RNA methyltransferase [Thermoanaerobaculia bacterium]